MTRKSQNQAKNAEDHRGVTRRNMLMGSTALAAARFAGRAGLGGLAASLVPAASAFAQGARPE